MFECWSPAPPATAPAARKAAPTATGESTPASIARVSTPAPVTGGSTPASVTGEPTPTTTLWSIRDRCSSVPGHRCRCQRRPLPRESGQAPAPVARRPPPPGRCPCPTRLSRVPLRTRHSRRHAVVRGPPGCRSHLPKRPCPPCSPSWPQTFSAPGRVPVVPARHGRETLPAPARPPGLPCQSAAGSHDPGTRYPAMLRVVLPGVPDIRPIDLVELAVSVDDDIDVAPHQSQSPQSAAPAINPAENENSIAASRRVPVIGKLCGVRPGPVNQSGVVCRHVDDLREVGGLDLDNG